jgi:hypothetical protein
MDVTFDPAVAWFEMKLRWSLRWSQDGFTGTLYICIDHTYVSSLDAATNWHAAYY